MTYLLDRNAVSAPMRADARMASWLSSIGVDDRVAICTIARGEILFGLERLAPGRRRTELEGKAGNLFAVLPCEPIPPAAGDLYAHVKVSQQRRGLPLDENDLWIAATALAMDAALVSRDSDFQAIGGLRVVEPWRRYSSRAGVSQPMPPAPTGGRDCGAIARTIRRTRMPMKNPPHPGDLIRTEIVEALGLNVSKAAEILKVRRATLSDLLHAKAALTPEMALRIEKAFGPDMNHLLRMQLAYDVAKTRQHARDIAVKRYVPP